MQVGETGDDFLSLSLCLSLSPPPSDQTVPLRLILPVLCGRGICLLILRERVLRVRIWS